jgi:hypothetical protein
MIGWRTAAYKRGFRQLQPNLPKADFQALRNGFRIVITQQE